MKYKHLKVHDHLNWAEAIIYIKALTGELLENTDIERLVKSGAINLFRYLPKPPWGSWRGLAARDGQATKIDAIGLQRYLLGETLYYGGGCHKGLEKSDYPLHCFKGEVAVDGDKKLEHKWWLAGFDVEITDLFFLRRDIEALATKMNAEPDNQALQDENQRLQQELEALKAEMERLEAENAQLKAGDEMNPRKEDTLYKLIIGMAQKGYRYDPNAQKNSAVDDIFRDLELLGIGLGETTIRKHLNAARAYLPAKPIKT